MDRKLHLLYTSLALAAAIYILHMLANALYLYWIYWWFDVLMHFTVGVTVGLISYWVLFYSGLLFDDLRGKWFRILAVAACILVAGVAWEVFEYVYGITDSHEGYVLDTVNDLILDVAGAVLPVLIVLRKRNNSSTSSL